MSKVWDDMTEQERYDTLQAMKVYGGGFAGRLAEAWQVADSWNSNRLAAAFPDLITKYSTGDWQ